MAGRSDVGLSEPALAGREDKLILICHEGYSASLAAVRLHELGFENTTDVIEGHGLHDRGLATAQWRKNDVMVAVIESSLAPGDYPRLTQFARVISPRT